MTPGNAMSSQGYKLWISDDWYIPVDAKGRCIGQCAEGALGFVIQLRSERDEKYHMALKIPRLMGETRRENAYINELAAKELKAVQDVFHTSGEKSCLLEAHVGNGSLFRGPISIKTGSAEAQKWDGALVLVYYEKGKNPTFCLVKFDDKTPEHHPPEVECPVTATAAYEKIKKSAKKSERDWEQTVFIDEGEGHKGNLDIFSVEDALKSESAGKTWYTCLPSIMYNWAPITLQEAISLNKREGPWDKNKHFVLIERVCRGLVALHNKGMLHADVRPANIVYEGVPTNPNDYSLSDYGSFTNPGARPTDPRSGPGGETVLGPVVSGERISAFYAPERRHSKEREAANTAVIHSSGSTFLYVILGWASDLIDETTGKPKEVFKNTFNVESLEKHDNPQQSNLDKGDRIQIRDYIFEVDQEWNIEDRQILKCEPRFWKVYHGRIVVESNGSLQEWNSFPISRSVELQQWSAATDMYSLGALALYSVFCDSAHKSGENRSAMEDNFREMLGYLENVEYFKAIWPDLEWMRSQLEGHFANPELTKDKVAIQPFTAYFGAPLSESEKILKGAVEKLVTRITQSVPYVRDIVEALDYDLGTFIFFIHFVLCCIHRESELDQHLAFEKIRPFAKSRLEQPEPGGAAAKALERIEHIRGQLINHPFLLGLLNVDHNKISPFDIRPTETIRADLDQTKAKVDRALEYIDSSRRFRLLFSGFEPVRKILQGAKDPDVRP